MGADVVEMTLRGTEKAAILLIALGPELASQVLKHCDERDIERVTLAIFNMQNVPGRSRTPCSRSACS